MKRFFSSCPSLHPWRSPAPPAIVVAADFSETRRPAASGRGGARASAVQPPRDRRLRGRDPGPGQRRIASPSKWRGGRLRSLRLDVTDGKLTIANPDAAPVVARLRGWQGGARAHHADISESSTRSPSRARSSFGPTGCSRSPRGVGVGRDVGPHRRARSEGADRRSDRARIKMEIAGRTVAQTDPDLGRRRLPGGEARTAKRPR